MNNHFQSLINVLLFLPIQYVCGRFPSSLTQNKHSIRPEVTTDVRHSRLCLVGLVKAIQCTLIFLSPKLMSPGNPTSHMFNIRKKTFFRCLIKCNGNQLERFLMLVLFCEEIESSVVYIVWGEGAFGHGPLLCLSQKGIILFCHWRPESLSISFWCLKTALNKLHK